MNSQRAMERAAGVLFFLFTVTLIVHIATEVEIDTDTDKFVDSLHDIARDRGQYLTSVAFHAVSSLLTVFMGAAIYLVFRSHSRPLALLASFGFLTAGIALLVGNMAGFALDPLTRQFFAPGGGAGTDAVAASARGTALLSEFAFEIGVFFAGLSVLLLGALIASTGAVYRPLGFLAGIGGILMSFHWLGLVEDDLVFIARAGLVITLVFLLVTGGWLILRGTRDARSA